MSYTSGGLIQASDFNNLVGNTSGNTANTINSVWAVGSYGFGYGQTAFSNSVSTSSLVAANAWANLTSFTSNIAAHQGTSLGSVTTPATGGTVTYQANVATNITTINTNKWNAAAQGTPTTAIYSHPTTNISDFASNVVVQFANADATRYFFNAGGQIKFQFSHPNGSTSNDVSLRTLCQDVGTIVFSAMNSGTATIVGVTYNGVTRIGGSGTSLNQMFPNNGYYASVTSSPGIQTFVQTDSSYGTRQLAGFARTNGTQGSNGDKGNILTFATYFLCGNVASGTTVTASVVYPSTARLANTWGAASLSNTWSA